MFFTGLPKEKKEEGGPNWKMFQSGGFESNPDLPNYVQKLLQFSQNPVLKPTTTTQTNVDILEMISVVNTEIKYLKTRIDQLITQINLTCATCELDIQLRESRKEALVWKKLYLAEIGKQM